MNILHKLLKNENNNKKTHEEFTKKFGGKVFYIISITEGKNKRIRNVEVIDEIKNEMLRLNQ